MCCNKESTCSCHVNFTGLAEQETKERLQKIHDCDAVKGSEPSEAVRIAEDMAGAIIRDFSAQDAVKAVSIIKHTILDHFQEVLKINEGELQHYTKSKTDFLHRHADAIEQLKTV